MLITIDRIIPGEERTLGYMRYPSVLVGFTSSVMTGSAWFVPASDDRQGIVGQSFGVEINQESVSAFKVVEQSEDQSHSVIPLPIRSCFQVCGIVTSVDVFNMAYKNPEYDPVIQIRVGDAHFFTTKAACGLDVPTNGQTVIFNANELSLWDEAL